MKNSIVTPIRQGNERAIRDALPGVLIGLKAVGSRVTCVPAPTDTDEDWLVLVLKDPENELTAAGFVMEGNPEFYTGNDNGGFRSWRKGEINLIVTQDTHFYSLFETATELARRYNLLEKSDRIALFQAVLYQVPYYQHEQNFTRTKSAMPSTLG